MAKRLGKPGVRPDQAARWLVRYEAGEPMSAIALKDSHDLRTVKAHIQLALSEREAREVRLALMRDALRLHFEDLMKLTTRLKKMVNVESGLRVSPRDKPLLNALRQHLSRSPLWTDVNNWHTILQRQEDIWVKVRVKLSDLRSAFPGLTDSSMFQLTNAHEGISNSLQFQLDEWSRGNTGLTVGKHLTVELADDDMVMVYYGATFIDKTPCANAQVINEVLPKMEMDIRNWPELESLKSIRIELRGIQEKLNDELNAVVLRRVLPGRCRLCPY